MKLHVLAVIVIAIIVLVTMMNKSSSSNYTVYGTKGCPWCRKQIEYFEKNGTSFKFVDCNKQSCKGMDAFPTIISPSGEKTVGFKEF